MVQPNDIPDWQGSVPESFQLLVAADSYTYTGVRTIVPAVLGKSIFLKHFSWSSWQTVVVLTLGQLKDQLGDILYSFNFSGTAGGTADLSGVYTAPGGIVTLGPGEAGAHTGLSYNLTYYYG